MSDVFISTPALALLPALALGLLHHWSRHRLMLVAAAAWALYWLYEEGMRQRILCSGECNIRIDLLLIHPVLIVLSAVALVLGFRHVHSGRR